jgi:hypothetical protein
MHGFTLLAGPDGLLNPCMNARPHAVGFLKHFPPPAEQLDGRDISVRLPFHSINPAADRGDGTWH